MFVPDYKNAIPGYTGHRPEASGDRADLQQTKVPRKQIPKYAGYIPGVKSENVFGETYGKTSFMSSNGDIMRGIDQPAGIKFSSMATNTLINHADVADQLETVAQIVGVQRGEDMYKKVSSPSRITRLHLFHQLLSMVIATPFL